VTRGGECGMSNDYCPFLIMEISMDAGLPREIDVWISQGGITYLNIVTRHFFPFAFCLLPFAFCLLPFAFSSQLSIFDR
ncbi:MAG: hypothetical protein OQK61_02700, partial [Ignavibacteriaceae bacterium]|nr:hypothetical protein [Ignavibacteriaceae bacterium]